MPTKYCFKCYIHLLINSDDIPLEEQIFNVLNSNKNIVTMAVSVSIFWGTFLHRVLEVKILTGHEILSDYQFEKYALKVKL